MMFAQPTTSLTDDQIVPSGLADVLGLSQLPREQLNG